MLVPPCPGMIESNSFMYAAATAAAYGCHRLFLCESASSQIPRIRRHGNASIILVRISRLEQQIVCRARLGIFCCHPRILLQHL